MMLMVLHDRLAIINLSMVVVLINTGCDVRVHSDAYAPKPYRVRPWRLSA